MIDVPLVHGIRIECTTKYKFQTHNAAKPMDLLPLLFDPNYVEYSDHDFVVQIIIPNLESFLALKEDPIYKERVAMDHLNFADRTDRARRTRYDTPVRSIAYYSSYNPIS